MNTPITTQTGSRTTRPQDNEIDVGKYLILFFENWYWFVLAIFLSLLTTWLINKNFVKIFRVEATLIVEDESKNPFSSSMFGGSSLTSGYSAYSSWYNFQNQILILGSGSLISRTLHELDFEVSYYIDEVWRPREIWDEAPFIVVPDKTRPQPLGVKFEVTIGTNGNMKIKSLKNGDEVNIYNFSTERLSGQVEDFSLDREVKYGELIDGNGYSFTLIPREGALATDKPAAATYLFSFNSYESLLQKWSSVLQLTSVDKDASMVKLSAATECPAKARFFINTHLEMYRQRTLDKKNQFATNTIDFIDKQLTEITESLRSTETNLQNFKKDNQVVDLSFQAQQLFDQARELDDKKAEVKIKGDYYQYIKDYLVKNSDAGNLVAPSVVGIDDPLLNNLVLELNKMADQKIAMTGGGGSGENPYLATIGLQIRNARATLEENIRNIINNNNQAIKDIDQRLNSVMVEVRKLPETERELFGIERQFKLNDQIYTYLLQRRAEAQIAKASNTPDNEIIDPARVVLPNIKPRTARNYLFGLILGLFIPGLILITKEIFNIKIETEEEVKKITSFPVAGHIAHSKSESATIVLSEPRSNISEAFRNVRTRMQFFTREIMNPVILVTSSMAAEGKTFTALNLASVYSLSGAKTILIGFDLRRPGIFEEFGIDNQKGISTYLIGRDKLDDIIFKTGFENLSVIPAGPIPPNPSELAASAKTKMLFDELRRKFEFIIVDSAPIGSVSDTYSLAHVADAVIMMVRHNKTIKHLLKDTIEDCKANGVNNISILMNDIRDDMRMYGYKGRYGYTYGYRHSYGDKGEG
jgi:tyrosine-protein kinase Etk/Wzc